MSLLSSHKQINEILAIIYVKENTLLLGSKNTTNLIVYNYETKMEVAKISNPTGDVCPWRLAPLS
jgi:hypothetical protein